MENKGSERVKILENSPNSSMYLIITLQESKTRAKRFLLEVKDLSGDLIIFAN
jgi:hypothetical protein